MSMMMMKDRQQLAIPSRFLLGLLILASTCLTCQSFTTTSTTTSTSLSTTLLKGTDQKCMRLGLGLTESPGPRTSSALFLFDPENERENQKENESESNNDVLSRFTSPIIDDPALPLSDVLVAQVIAPSIQIVWLSLNHAPTPGWLRPIFDTNTQLFEARGSLLAPALIHGAALGSCWIVGALAAKAYERAAIAPVTGDTQTNTPDSGYGTVLWRVVQAGAFASGVLILSTQIDLFLEYNGRWVQPGESPETDLRLLTAGVELLNDIFFEAVCLVSWRLFLARQTAQGGNR